MLFISKSYDYEAEEIQEEEQNDEEKQTDNERRENQSAVPAEEEDLFDIDDSCTSDIWYL